MPSITLHTTKTQFIIMKSVTI